MLRKLIDRPVLVTVCSIVLLILGFLGLKSLPISRFPDIAPPTVAVSATYPGANAETVLRSVLIPLEEAINGAENMKYMISSATNDGSASIDVLFDLSTDPDQAAVDIQNRITRATPRLPAEVIALGITTRKQQRTSLMFIALYDSANSYDAKFLENYATINILPVLQRVKGVGNVRVFGSHDYAIRIWMDPQKLVAHDLTPQDIIASIKDQSLETAPGQLGKNSDSQLEYVIRYSGKYNTVDQYKKIILRTDGTSILYLGDVVDIELGASSYDVVSKFNGQTGLTIGIMQTPGSNANDVQVAVEKVLKEAAPKFPYGVKYEVLFDTKSHLDVSIRQVQQTIIEAFILVFLIVFIFLQDLRSTLIPAIAVPVSLIGTFFFLNLFGFSINMLTLFALVLSIGIVVDDSIVVVEAVHSKMERERINGKRATHAAMSEISGAIISITLVMVAVFFPIGFIEGSVGAFYKQFAFTLAIAILISAFNALTLAPALCALFLNKAHGELQPTTFLNRLYINFNKGFNAIIKKYIRTVQKLIVRQVWALAALAIVIIGTILFMKYTPKGFIPAEDSNMVVFAAALSPGTSLYRTQETMEKTFKVLKSVEAIKAQTYVAGFDLLSGAAGSSYALSFMSLKPIPARGKVKDIKEVMALITEKLSTIPDAKFNVFTFPTVPGFSSFDGLQLEFQDKKGGSVEVLNNTAQTFIDELMQDKAVAYAFTSFKTGFPQYELSVDPVAAKLKDLNITALLRTIQLYFSGSQVSDFNLYSKFYRVYIQASPQSRTDPSSLNNIFVRNTKGELVPISGVVQLKKVYGPELITRYNMFNSITVNAQPAPGYSSGDAMQAIERIAKKYILSGYDFEWTGMSREEQAAGSQTVVIFLLSILFVYLILAAQYESYIIPFAVLFSLPVGVIGVFATINLVGIENNIYVQVGLVMLLGLLAKNAILIVEFAAQNRKLGCTITKAALIAAQVRLRPILMTSLAFVVGLVPLIHVVGPSAQGNKSISVGTIGGMISGIILGVFIIPVLYIAFASLEDKLTKKLKKH